MQFLRHNSQAAFQIISVLFDEKTVRSRLHVVNWSQCTSRVVDKMHNWESPTLQSEVCFSLFAQHKPR